MNAENSPLPADVAAMLRALALREQRLRVLLGLALWVGSLLLLALALMSLDWLAVWFHPFARWASSLLLLAAAGGLAWLGWPKLSRPRSLTAVAQQAEATAPDLEERWSTLASLHGEEGTKVAGSASLVARVATEASRLGSGLTAESVLPARAFVLKALAWVAIAALGWLVLAGVDAERLGVLATRLAMPWAQASLTQVSLLSSETVIPRHEPYTLEAQLAGRMPAQAELRLREEPGGQLQRLSLAPTDEDRTRVAHLLKDPINDFAYSFRAGDGQSLTQQVIVADRPVLRSVSLVIRPPAGSGLPVRREDSLPSRLRLVEGSTLELAFATSDALQRLELHRSYDGQPPEKPLPLTRSGGAYAHAETPARGFRFYPVLISEQGLSNTAPPVCQVEVLPDARPVVAFTADSAKSAVTAQDEVAFDFAASDDFGLVKASARLLLEDEGQPARVIELPCEPLANPARQLQQRLPVKLSQHAILSTTRVACLVSVTDTHGSSSEVRSMLPIDEFAKEPANALTPEALLALAPAIEKMIATLQQAKADSAAAQQAPPDKADQAAKDQAAALAGALAALAQSQAFQKQTQGSQLDHLAKAMQRLTEQSLQPAKEALAKANAAASSASPAEAGKQGNAGEQASAAAQAASEAQALLQQAIAQAQALLERTKAEAKAQATAALAAQLQKMHAVNVAGLAQLPQGSKAGELLKRPNLPSIEVDEAYLEAQRQRLENMREALRQLASLLNQDPELRSRLIDAQTSTTMNLRDQLHLLAIQQHGLFLGTSLAAKAAALAAAAKALPNPEQAQANAEQAISQALTSFIQLRDRQQAKALEDTATLAHKAKTWQPKPTAPAQQVPLLNALLEPLERAAKRTANEGSALLDDLIAAREALVPLAAEPGFADFAERRQNEADALLLQQSWLISVDAALARRSLPEVTGLQQRNLWRQTAELGAKIADRAEVYRALSPYIAGLIDALVTGLNSQALSAQDRAASHLLAQVWQPGLEAQTEAKTALARAEAAYAALLEAIAEEQRKRPPAAPPPPGTEPPDLDAFLALLEKEMNEVDDFGAAKFSLNAQLNADWPSLCKGGNCNNPSPLKPGGKPSSSSQNNMAQASGEQPKPGEQPGQTGAGKLTPAQLAQALAQAERERQLSGQAAAARSALMTQARALAVAMKEGEDISKTDLTQESQARRLDWNQLPSSLQKDLRQQRDTPPPEEYRALVEAYFRRIAGQR